MAKGSHATYAGWEPRECAHCGAKITLKTGGLFHNPADGEPWSTCRRTECIEKGRPRA